MLLKGAFFVSGCLSKGTKIKMCYRKRNCLPGCLPTGTMLQRNSLFGCLSKGPMLQKFLPERNCLAGCLFKETKIQHCYPKTNSLAGCLYKGTNIWKCCPKRNNPAVLTREKQPSLKRQKDQDVLPKEKKTCLVSLQRTKDSEVLPREKQQPSQLPLQTNKDRKIVPREKQLSQLPLQRNKDPAVLSREEQPSQLLLQNQKVPRVLLREEQPCSVSGRTADASVQGRCEPAPVLGRDEGEKPCSTSGIEGKEDRKSKRRASQYNELFEKWVEPPLLSSLPPTDIDDDQGWLLKTNKNPNCEVEKCVAASDSLSCGDSVSWPRARLLPEVDIYALPYTVPF
ncbi:hypothetical protein ABKV19_001380 [Rosa sericea]